jgi:hypothetical protein
VYLFTGALYKSISVLQKIAVPLKAWIHFQQVNNNVYSKSVRYAFNVYRDIGCFIPGDVTQANSSMHSSSPAAMKNHALSLPV